MCFCVYRHQNCVYSFLNGLFFNRTDIKKSLDLKSQYALCPIFFLLLLLFSVLVLFDIDTQKNFFREDQQTRLNFYIIFFSLFTMNTTPSTQVKKKYNQSLFYSPWLLFFYSFFFCTTHCLALYQIINSVLNPFFYFIFFFLWMKELKKLSFILFYFSLVSCYIQLFLHMYIN